MACLTDTSISAAFGGGTQAQHDPQMQIVTEHADEVLGGAPAVLDVDLAPGLKLLQDDGQPRRGSSGTAFEERLGQFRKARAFRDDGAIKSERHRRHHGVENPPAECE